MKVGDTYFLPERSFSEFFLRLSRERRLVGPVASGGRLSWARIAPGGAPTPNPARMAAPARLALAAYGERDGNLALFGAKACEIAGLSRAGRSSVLVLSMDCEEILEGCACGAAGGAPFARSGFALNFSRVERGFLVDVGTRDGEAVIEKNIACFRGPADGQKAERDERRRMHLSRLRGRRIRRTRPTDDDACATCIACLRVCPACEEGPEDEGADARATMKAVRCTGCGRCACACPLGRVAAGGKR